MTQRNGHKIWRNLKMMSTESSFGYVEAHKALRTNISYLLPDTGKGHVIMITSAVPGEGKSNVSVNLAYSYAQEKKRVVLIDCDLRKGTLHRYLDVPALAPGLSSVLKGKIALDTAIVHLKYGFDFIPVGALPTNPSELIGSSSMSDMLAALADSYDTIICDTAPVLSVADTAILCRFVDGVVFVISHNDTTRNTALAAKESLEQANANILGVVLNKYDAKETGTDAYNYYSYYNYSNYGYGDDSKKQ